MEVSYVVYILINRSLPMKIFKAITNSVSNLLQLVDFALGDEGLKKTVKESFDIINSSLESSAKMTKMEAKAEFEEFEREFKVLVAAKKRKERAAAAK
jgi:hypothetical protein